jgi:hypothetical protein
VFDCGNRGFESRWGNGCLSLVAMFDTEYFLHHIYSLFHCLIYLIVHLLEQKIWFVSCVCVALVAAFVTGQSLVQLSPTECVIKCNNNPSPTECVIKYNNDPSPTECVKKCNNNPSPTECVIKVQQ